MEHKCSVRAFYISSVFSNYEKIPASIKYNVIAQKDLFQYFNIAKGLNLYFKTAINS